MKWEIISSLKVDRTALSKAPLFDGGGISQLTGSQSHLKSDCARLRFFVFQKTRIVDKVH